MPLQKSDAVVETFPPLPGVLACAVFVISLAVAMRNFVFNLAFVAHYTSDEQVTTPMELSARKLSHGLLVDALAVAAPVWMPVKPLADVHTPVAVLALAVTGARAVLEVACVLLAAFAGFSAMAMRKVLPRFQRFSRLGVR